MGYLHNYIHFYAQLAAPLQGLRTSLLCNASVSDQQCQAYTSKMKIRLPIPEELASFQSIKNTLSHLFTLINYNLEKILWIYLNASKELGFGAVVFYTIIDKVLFNKPWPISSSVLYLSRLFTAVEKNYWLTELEITGFVWVIKKVRHLVEFSQARVIIQTDHSAILDILAQSSITLISSIMRLNLWLVRAFPFL